VSKSKAGSSKPKPGSSKPKPGSSKPKPGSSKPKPGPFQFRVATLSDEHMQKAWEDYYFGNEHSRLASFPMRYGSIHASFPVVFMTKDWRALVKAQKVLGTRGIFKTQEQYTLFEEYLEWSEYYAQLLKNKI
jgi:hypothetical protein